MYELFKYFPDALFVLTTEFFNFCLLKKRIEDFSAVFEEFIIALGLKWEAGLKRVPL